MKQSTRTMIAGAAVAGLLSGAFASQASALPATGGTSASNAATSLGAGTMAVSLADADTGKHDCKGKNDCKGQGGCKTDANSCKGKNDCKGKGGCATKTS